MYSPHIRGRMQKTFQTAEQALTKNVTCLVLLVLWSRHKSKQHSSFNSITIKSYYVMLLFDSIVDFLASQFLLLTVQVAPAWYSCLLLLLLFVTPACYYCLLPLLVTAVCYFCLLLLLDTSVSCPCFWPWLTRISK